MTTVANVFARRDAMIARRMKASGSVEVSLSNGTDTIPALKAAIGKTGFDLDDGSGVIDRQESRDFIVTTADVDFGAGPVEPKTGWTITEILAGQTFVRKVGAPVNQPVVSYDAGRLLMRVRTWDRQ